MCYSCLLASITQELSEGQDLFFIVPAVMPSSHTGRAAVGWMQLMLKEC